MYEDFDLAANNDFADHPDRLWSTKIRGVDQQAMEALPIEPMDEEGFTVACASKNAALAPSVRDERTLFGPGCTSFKYDQSRRRLNGSGGRRRRSSRRRRTSRRRRAYVPPSPPPPSPPPPSPPPPVKKFFETPGSGAGAGRQHGSCTDTMAIVADNPNMKLVNTESMRQMSENTSAYVYHEGHSIESADSVCSLGSIADHKYFFSPGRYAGAGGNVCYQELCHVTTKAYNNGGSIFRHPDNGTGCTAFVEGQYPNDPDMCDIYAQDMCVQGYDITNSIDDSVPSSLFKWDQKTCSCVGAPARRSLQVDSRRAAMVNAHSA